jgi:hypothetical protein
MKWIWNRRLGHLIFDNLIKSDEKEALRVLSLQETLLGCISEMPGNLTNFVMVHSIVGNGYIKMNI